MGQSQSSRSQSSGNVNKQELFNEEAKDFVDQYGIDGLGKLHRTQINSWEKMKLNFLITGDSGAGKSSFINAIRGLKDYEYGAAKVGVVEAMEKATRYPPDPDSSSKIVYWDVPGIGTPNYPNMDEYCKEINLEMFDAILIFCRGRFTHYDLELAKKAKSIGTPFFFVRAHVSTDVSNAKKSDGPNFDEKKTLEKMRMNCLKYLEELLTCETDFYLIDNHEKEKWDFDRLMDDVGNNLPKKSEECFILSLSNVTRDCLKRKAKMLKVRAGVLAVATASSSAIPVPFVGAALDVALIFGEVVHYHKQFGIPVKDSRKFQKLNKNLQETILMFTFGSVKTLAIELGTEIGLELGMEEASKFIPIVGVVLACAISATTTSRYLIRCIDKLEETALQIWDAEHDFTHRHDN